MRPEYRFIPPDLHQRVLLTFGLRGHRRPRDPFTLSPEEMEHHVVLRARPMTEKRWMPGSEGEESGLRGIIRGTIVRACEKRSGRCLEVVIARSCVFAVVEVPVMSERGLCDAIRLVTTRRAQSKIGWPKNERVFSSHAADREMSAEECAVPLRVRFPGIERL